MVNMYWLEDLPEEVFGSEEWQEYLDALEEYDHSEYEESLQLED